MSIDPNIAITTLGKFNLVIVGANDGVDPCNGTRGPESIITFPCTLSDCNVLAACNGSGIEINSAGVTISGFTIQGNPCGPGITTTKLSFGTVISQNIIQDNMFGIYLNSLTPFPPKGSGAVVFQNLIQKQ